MESKVYITLLSTDSYMWGAIMLNTCLKKVHAQYPLHVVCSDSISERTIATLHQCGLTTIQLTEHLNQATDMSDREDSYWRNTFDKLYVWDMTQYEKVVFLDSDMQIVRNIDDLFEQPHMSAVIADQFDEPGLEKLNSGLIVIEPNHDEFVGLSTLAKDFYYREHVGDQDVIRAYYSDWYSRNCVIPPSYNILYDQCNSQRGNIRKENVIPVFVIHYIGKKKPWMMTIRAIYRRTKNNFLGRYIVAYYFSLQWQRFLMRIKRISAK